MNKEVRELIARAKRHGWIDDGYTGKGHRRLVWPATGEAVVMASTPSEPSGLKWALRDLERIGGPLGASRGRGRSKEQRRAEQDRAKTLQRATRDRRRARERPPAVAAAGDGWKAQLARLAVERGFGDTPDGTGGV